MERQRLTVRMRASNRPRAFVSTPPTGSPPRIYFHVPKNLRSVYRFFRMYKSNEIRFLPQLVYSEIFEVLLRKEESDPFLFGTITDMILNRHPHIGSVLYHSRPHVLEFMLLNIQLYCKGTDAGLYKKVQNFFTLYKCFFDGNVPSLQVLLKYGHESSFFIDNYTPWHSSGGITSRERNILKRQYLIMQIFRNLLHNTITEESLEHGWRLLWSALPHPYISRDEVTTALSGIQKRGPQLNWKTLLETIDKCLCPLQQLEPRSLQQYCRCAIRKNLNVVCGLPHAIDELNIPQKIRSYLKLEC